MDYVTHINNARLAIFDLDGTLANLEDLNFYTFSEIVNKNLNRTVTNDDYQNHFSGRGSLFGFETYLTANGLSSENAKELQKQFSALKKKELEYNFDKHVSVIKGAYSFLSYLANAGIHRSLATSTGRVFSRLILDKTELIAHFEHIVDREDVIHIKPNPEIFIKALDAFSCNASEAVVFEDSVNGIRAAKAAGIYCIAILTPGKNDSFVGEADYVVNTYEDILRDIENS